MVCLLPDSIALDRIFSQRLFQKRELFSFLNLGLRCVDGKVGDERLKVLAMEAEPSFLQP